MTRSRRRAGCRRRGEHRIGAMVNNRPDWVISRQRAWGVPITVFIKESADGSVEMLNDPEVNDADHRRLRGRGRRRLVRAGRARAVSRQASATKAGRRSTTFSMSGSIPARRTPSCSRTRAHFPRWRIQAQADGGDETVVYLEGSDQHRGWFQSSLLGSSAARAAARPSISWSRTVFARRKRAEDVEVAGQRGRAAGCHRSIGRRHPAAMDLRRRTIATICASARKSSRPRPRPTASCATRCAGCSARSRISQAADRVAFAEMPELERLMLHRLPSSMRLVRTGYTDFDYKRIVAALDAFMTADLSAFYFDIRKDALYCDPYSSLSAKRCSTVLDHLFRCTVTWLAPILCLHRRGGLARARSGERRRLRASGSLSRARRRAGATMRWRRNGASCAACAASSPARSNSSGPANASALRWKPRRSSMSRTPTCSRSLPTSISPRSCITSAATLIEGEGPPDGLPAGRCAGVAVEPRRRKGANARAPGRFRPPSAAIPQYPDVTPRDAQALREWDAMRKAAE